LLPLIAAQDDFRGGTWHPAFLLVSLFMQVDTRERWKAAFR
jgi:hypothetical protein